MTRAGVLLDRDGTIIVDTGYVGSAAEVKLLDGAGEAIAAFNRAGLPVAIVTNQSGVARGYFDLHEVAAVNQRMEALLAEHGAHIDAIYICPDLEKTTHRKPAPGMALQAAEELCLDLCRSVVIGDKTSDVELALNIGAQGILVGDRACDLEGFVRFGSLGEATAFVLERLG